MRNWIKSPPWERHPAPVTVDGQSPSLSRAELDAAYQKGRRDGAKRRRGSPILAFIGLIATAAVALMIYLAVQNGSFSNGGAVVDNDLVNASQRVQAPINNAASKAGNALESAGHNLKQRAGDQTPNP